MTAKPTEDEEDFKKGNKEWQLVCSGGSYLANPFWGLPWKLIFFKKIKIVLFKAYNTRFDMHLHSEMITRVKLINTASTHIVNTVCVCVFVHVCVRRAPEIYIHFVPKRKTFC